MRPVDKGTSTKHYAKYQDASDDLTKKLGFMCSYCEMDISNNPAVEHVQPKSKNPKLINEWSNFLLGCTYCNSAKNDYNDDREGYYFPDEYNTAYIFNWTKDKVVEPNPLLSEEEQKIAQNTIDLVKLNRTSAMARALNKRANREIKREEAWSIAEKRLEDLHKIRNDLLKCNDEELINKIIKTFAHSMAVGIESHVSIYMKVFENEPTVLNEIINNSKGIRRECFREDGNPKSIIKIQNMGPENAC